MPTASALALLPLPCTQANAAAVATPAPPQASAQGALAGLDLSALTALSPIDGRYGGQAALQQLRGLMSEYGLMKFRILIEVCRSWANGRTPPSRTQRKHTWRQLGNACPDFCGSGGPRHWRAVDLSDG